MPDRKTSLTMDAQLPDEARRYGINVSAAAQTGVETIAKTERQRRWKEENQAWIGAYNVWIEKNGIPLAEYRKF